MKQLQELGLDTSNASACYDVCDEDGEKQLMWKSQLEESDMYDDSFSIVPAYTLQDVLELLPSSVNWNRLLITFNGCECIFQYAIYEGDPIVAFHNEEMIDAAYEMLCWCIENGYVKTNKENMQ